MTEKRRHSHSDAEHAYGEGRDQTCSSEEARVWAALEQARQNVKAIVKKEKEADVVTADLLNLRLKAV